MNVLIATVDGDTVAILAAHIEDAEEHCKSTSAISVYTFPGMLRSIPEYPNARRVGRWGRS